MTEHRGTTRDPRSTRRDFARNLAAVAAAPLVAKIPKAEAQASEPAKPEGAAAEAQALAELVRLHYGKHLTDEQLEEIKRALERSRHTAQRLRQFKLQNSDEPAFTFRVELG